MTSSVAPRLCEHARSRLFAVEQSLRGALLPGRELEWQLQGFSRSRYEGPVRRGEAVAFGVPWDTGSSFVCGSAEGPFVLRSLLPSALPYLGEIPVVPQLLSDEMYTPQVLSAARKAVGLCPDESCREGGAVPVSPVSLTRSVVSALWQQGWGPAIILGGDHTLALAGTLGALDRFERLLVVDFDAHPDLSDTRLGVGVCFSTWARRLVEAAGDRVALVQVGVRETRRTQSHWEGVGNVSQIWRGQLRKEPGALSEVLSRQSERLSPAAVYITIDLDCLEPGHFSSVAHPSADGLSSEFLQGALAEVAAVGIPFAGADVCEFAPRLGASAHHLTDDLDVLRSITSSLVSTLSTAARPVDVSG